jgi:hypothetical protein
MQFQIDSIALLFVEQLIYTPKSILNKGELSCNCFS